MPLLPKYLFGDAQLEKIQTKLVGLHEFGNIKSLASILLKFTEKSDPEVARAASHKIGYTMYANV